MGKKMQGKHTQDKQMSKHSAWTWLDAYQLKVRQIRSSRKGTAALLVGIVVIMTLVGAAYDKAFAQCPRGEQCLSSAQYVKHFKAGDLSRSHGVHPAKRFAAPAWTRDYFATKIRNRLQSSSKAEVNSAYEVEAQAQGRPSSEFTNTCDLLCLAYAKYDRVMANSSCVPRGRYFYRSNLCAGAYGTNPISKADVKNGGRISLCSGVLVLGVAGAPEDVPILMAGGLGFMSCVYDFLDNW